MEFGVAAQYSNPGELVKARVIGQLAGAVFSHQTSRFAPELAPRGPQRHDHHAVEGQGAGLVQAENLHGAQGFHGVQVTDGYVIAPHALDAQGQCGSRHSG